MEKIWTIGALNTRTGEWTQAKTGGEDQLSELLLDLLHWKSMGQQVRLEWSEKN